jgi:hypothetical protein
MEHQSVEPKLSEIAAYVAQVLERAECGDAVDSALECCAAPDTLADGAEQRRLLRDLGSITVRPGRGAPTWSDGPRAKVDQVLSDVERLAGVIQRQDWVTLDELALLIPDEERRERAIRILKQLEIAVGVRKAGGLKRYASTQAEAEAVVEAEPDSTASEDEAPPAPRLPSTPPQPRHESAYYEYVADKLRLEDWQVTIAGVRQRLPGQWRTPDIVGYRVTQSVALLTPVVRVVTVEVKHVVDLVAIAEAEAHLRFAHYAYVAVPQAPGEIPSALVTEVARRGLGLICPRQKNSLSFYSHIDPPLHRPDEAEVDGFLASIMDEGGRAPLSQLVASEVRRAMAVLFTA